MSKIINICWQQASAMAYLTSKNIVHRTLMARNVLLVNEDLSKLTEFSKAKRLDVENKCTCNYSEFLAWFLLFTSTAIANLKSQLLNDVVVVIISTKTSQ